jgi:hypothetical protein
MNAQAHHPPHSRLYQAPLGAAPIAIGTAARLSPQYHKDWVGGHLRTIVKRWEPRHGDKLVFRWDDGSHEYDPDQVGIRVSRPAITKWTNTHSNDFTGQSATRSKGRNTA